MCVCVCVVCVRKCVCVIFLCTKKKFVRACVREVLGARRIITRLRMHVRTWAEGGEGKIRLTRYSRFLWKLSMREMTSTGIN